MRAFVREVVVRERNTFIELVGDGCNEEGAQGSVRRGSSEPPSMLSAQAARGSKEDFVCLAGALPGVDASEASQFKTGGSVNSSTEQECKGRKAVCMNPDHKGTKEYVYYVELLGGLCRNCYLVRESERSKGIREEVEENDTDATQFEEVLDGEASWKLRCVLCKERVGHSGRRAGSQH